VNESGDAIDRGTEQVMSVVYDYSSGLINSCCKWVSNSVTSPKPRNVTHPLNSIAGLKKMLRASVQIFYKFRRNSFACSLEFWRVQ